MKLRDLEALLANRFVADPDAVASTLGADPSGVRLASLLVVKLRFERLLRASPEAEAAFERSPEEFVREFDRYVREVPPTAFFPRAEAALFLAWQATRR